VVLGGGGTATDVSVLTASTTEHAAYCDTSVMLGGEVGGVNVEAGIKTKFDASTGWGSSQKSTISSEVEFPGIEPDDPTPDKFRRYGDWTLMLSPTASTPPSSRSSVTRTPRATTRGCWRRSCRRRQSRGS